MLKDTNANSIPEPYLKRIFFYKLSHTTCWEEKTSWPIISFYLSKYWAHVNVWTLFKFHSCMILPLHFLIVSVSVLTSYPYFLSFFPPLLMTHVWFFLFFSFKAHSHSAVIMFTVIPHRIQNMSPVSKAQFCVCQVLAVCIVQWERVRGCRSSVVLFLYWLLSVVCSLVPLRAKIQLAVEQVREMTRTPNLGHPFHGPVLKPSKTTHSHIPVYKPLHANVHTHMFKRCEKHICMHMHKVLH